MPHRSSRSSIGKVRGATVHPLTPTLGPLCRALRHRHDAVRDDHQVAATWGDGLSDPAVLDCEVTLDSALFDPSVRDELTAFYARALHSDYRQRFDNTEEMLRAWRQMFASVDRPTTETDHSSPVDYSDILAGATAETPLSTLGLSPRLLDALERIGA